MGQNEMLFYVTAIGCLACLMYGIYKKPSYLLVLAFRGAFCAVLIWAISVFCVHRGVRVVLDLNILSIGMGALLGLPGIIVLYAVGILCGVYF
jgi:inhibitor of the pro-sigma K processing machinery